MYRSSNNFLRGPPVAPEETDEEDTHALQFSQWTLPHFCAEVLLTGVSLLKDTDRKLVLQLLQMLRGVCSLLEDTVLPNLLWNDQSPPAREMVSSFSIMSNF